MEEWVRRFGASLPNAHDCIMVRVLGPTGYKVVARLNRAPKAGSPLIVIATALSVPSCSKHEGKRCAALANSLTKKAPYKGLGAESEEKREPVSDIDTGVVDSLKALDSDGRLEKRTSGTALGSTDKKGASTSTNRLAHTFDTR